MSSDAVKTGNDPFMTAYSLLSCSRMSLRHWLILSLTENIGPILARRLIEFTGSVEAACGANANVLRMIEGIGTAKSTIIAQSLRDAANLVDGELDRAAAAGARVICPEDERYSVLLKTIPDPPLVLYVKGTLEPRDLNAVAIVGSRKCSFYGREQAERFAALLGGAGVTVISGGARGVDSAAHRGALSNPEGRTIAVLGCGADVVYPPENVSLFEQIAQRGAIISEYPMETPPVAENFPKRNRIVSGLSRGVLVVEADERSGALITARQAGEDQGRPVFALPGRVDNKLSVGPHKLIRDGAILVTKLEDILEDLGPLPQGAMDEVLPTVVVFALSDETIAPPKNFNLSDQQQLIVDQLSSDAVNIETLIDRTGLDASIIVREITFLSLKGAVQRVDGQTYKRAR
jgi:DNA processing protein